MRRNRRFLTAVIFVLGLAAVLTGAIATPARAGFGIGGRAGVSAKPDQFVVGAQARLGPVMPAIEFVPSIDFGFGDHLNLTTINADLQLNLPSLPKVTPNMYVGAGPTLAQYDPDGGDGTTEIGLSLVAGLRVPMQVASYYNLEARFGIGDVPDVKILLGILFGL